MNNNAKIMMMKETVSDSLNSCPICHGTGYDLRYVNIEYPYPEATCVNMAYPCPKCKGVTNKLVSDLKKQAKIPFASDMSEFDWGLYGIAKDDKENPNFFKYPKIIDTFINNFETWNAKGSGLYIYSFTKGSGKTFLASCIGNSVMCKKGINVYFVPVANLLDIIKSGDRDATGYERNPIECFKNCKLLILDDIGATRSSEWLNEELFKIIDSRYLKKLPTIFTSNIRYSELKLDDRIVDRINNMVVPVKIPDKCIRDEKSKGRKNDLFEALGLI